MLSSYTCVLKSFYLKRSGIVVQFVCVSVFLMFLLSTFANAEGILRMKMVYIIENEIFMILILLIMIIITL